MKIFKLCMIALSLFVLSCDTDDAIPFDLNTENLSGIYEITALSSTDVESFTTGGETTTDTYISTGSDFNTTWTFSNNNTFTLTGTYTATESGEEDGEAYNDTYQETLNESGTYLLNVVNQTITLNFVDDEDDEAQVFEIVSFSEENVSLFYSESQVTSDFSSEFSVELDLARK